MKSSNVVFRNEITLKEFYLTNSFHCLVSFANEPSPNDEQNPNIYQTQHPQYNYKLLGHPRSDELDLQNKALQVETLPCQQEIVDYLIVENSVEIGAQAVQSSVYTGTIKKQLPIAKSTPSCNELVVNSAKNVVTNNEEFVCSICEMFIEIGNGIVLKECFHTFCRLCIVDSIEHTASMICPFRIENCNIEISDTEVRSLLSPASYNHVVEKMMMRISNDVVVHVEDLPEIYYLENLEANNYIENNEPFRCSICLNEINIQAGVVLKNCLHMFCKECLNKTIEYSDDVVVKCPFMDDLGSCEFFLQDSEFRSLASDNAIKQQHVKSLKQAELSAAGDAYHCKYPDCEGWVILDHTNPVDFICVVCLKNNCFACKVSE